MGIEILGITITATNDKGQGTFLGRTTASWVKIMGFYVVYYTFLAGLIYFSVTSYADKLVQPGSNKAPKIVTRVDMPGSSVEPFNTIDSAIDGDGMIKLSFKDDSAKGNKAYLDAFDAFSKTIVTENTINCLGQSAEVKTPADGPCAVSNGKFLNETVIRNLPQDLKDGQPTVAVMLNKVIGWTPINGYGLDNYPGRFFQNSVQIQCAETLLTGEIVAADQSNFKVDLIGNELSLLSGYYPYQGGDKNAVKSKNVAYIKPFVLAQIKLKEGVEKKEAWKTADGAFKYFRCQFFAENIDKPKVGKEFNEGTPAVKSWSTDLTALKIGFVEFGFSYE